MASLMNRTDEIMLLAEAERYLAFANGNAREALVWACLDKAIACDAVSAGFARAGIVPSILPLNEPESLDIPEADGD